MKLKHDIDFYSVYEKQLRLKQKAARAGKVSATVAVAAGALLIGGGYYYLNQQNSLLKQQETELKDYLTSSGAAQQYADLQELQSQCQDIRYYNELVSTARSTISERPMLSKSLYDEISKALTGRGTLVGFSEAEDTLYLSILFHRQGNAALYADALDKTALFRSVTYDGWVSDGGYLAEFTCVMKEAAKE